MGSMRGKLYKCHAACGTTCSMQGGVLSFGSAAGRALSEGPWRVHIDIYSFLAARPLLHTTLLLSAARSLAEHHLSPPPAPY